MVEEVAAKYARPDGTVNVSLNVSLGSVVPIVTPAFTKAFITYALSLSESVKQCKSVIMAQRDGGNKIRSFWMLNEFSKRQLNSAVLWRHFCLSNFFHLPSTLPFSTLEATPISKDDLASVVGHTFMTFLSSEYVANQMIEVFLLKDQHDINHYIEAWKLAYRQLSDCLYMLSRFDAVGKMHAQDLNILKRNVDILYGANKLRGMRKYEERLKKLKEAEEIEAEYQESIKNSKKKEKKHYGKKNKGKKKT
jgi:hypothetical protein